MENTVNNRNVRKQILLTEDTAVKLKAVSKTKNLSENEIINRSLHAYLRRFTITDYEEV